MASIVPAGELGKARVQHHTITEYEAGISQLRAVVTGGRESAVSKGTTCLLYVDDVLMMSDTSMEYRTNLDVVRKARGSVLIAGLGLGMILVPILKKPEVTEVTVLEQCQDVIDLVSPHFQDPRLKVICVDVFTYRPPKGKKYDVIYHDIWAYQSTDTLKEMAILHRKYGRYLAPNGWQESWRRGTLKAQKLRNAE